MLFELLALIASGALAGLLGSLLGIGGGVILVPFLVFAFDVPMEEAVPASLMCVVANSCAAAANYVDGRLADVRLAITLELATVAGALGGGLIAGLLRPSWVAMTFGLFALYVAVQIIIGRKAEASVESYEPRNLPLGIGGSFVAGGLSTVLGVGGGPVKVPLMNYGMGVPFKVASATSNLMIGVTGAASVAAYAFRGHLKLGLIAPLIVGALAGAMVGSRLMPKMPIALLRRLFAVVLLVIAAQMLWRGGRGMWLSQ